MDVGPPTQDDVNGDAGSSISDACGVAAAASRAASAMSTASTANDHVEELTKDDEEEEEEGEGEAVALVDCETHEDHEKQDGDGGGGGGGGGEGKGADDRPDDGEEVGSIALGGRVRQEDDYAEDALVKNVETRADAGNGVATDADKQCSKGCDSGNVKVNVDNAAAGKHEDDDDGVGVDVRSRREERGLIGGLVGGGVVGGGSGGDYMKAGCVYNDGDDKMDVHANAGCGGMGGYHVNVGGMEDVDDVRVCEAGHIVWEGGRMSVIKSDDDLKDSYSGDNNPYRKKVARVVVVISVVMLVMSILLVCVSLNMSKDIDDLVRSNNDLLRKSYEKDHFEEYDNVLVNTTRTNSTEP